VHKFVVSAWQRVHQHVYYCYFLIWCSAKNWPEIPFTSRLTLDNLSRDFWNSVLGIFGLVHFWQGSLHFMPMLTFAWCCFCAPLYCTFPIIWNPVNFFAKIQRHAIEGLAKVCKFTWSHEFVSRYSMPSTKRSCMGRDNISACRDN